MINTYLTSKWEDIDIVKKVESTAFAVGMWIQYNGDELGLAEPLEATERVLGLCLQSVSDSDATNSEIHYQRARDEFLFVMPVGNGTAVAAMVGSTFDIHTDSISLDVTGLGTQFIIDKFISASLVVVRPVLTN